MIYSPRNCVWSGRVTSISPLPACKRHWQPRREISFGLIALSIKSSSLSESSSRNSSPLSTYKWQVLQAHTPPQLWWRSISFFRATSKIDWSASTLFIVIGLKPFCSNLKVILYIVRIASEPRNYINIHKFIAFSSPNPQNPLPVSLSKGRQVIKLSNQSRKR